MKFDICIIFLESAYFLSSHFFASCVSCSNNDTRANEPSRDERLVFNHLISLFVLYLSDEEAV